MNFNGLNSSFDIKPVGFKIEFTKKFGELKNNLVLLVKIYHSNERKRNKNTLDGSLSIFLCKTGMKIVLKSF